MLGTYDIIGLNCAHFYNTFTIFKLRSTTEHIHALVEKENHFFLEVDVTITIFCDFRPFFCDKIGVFFKNQCYYDQIFA
jgi:hypothetical protein